MHALTLRETRYMFVIPQVLVRNIESRILPRLTEPGSAFDKSLRWFTGVLEFENHCSTPEFDKNVSLLLSYDVNSQIWKSKYRTYNLTNMSIFKETLRQDHCH